MFLISRIFKRLFYFLIPRKSVNAFLVKLSTVIKNKKSQKSLRQKNRILLFYFKYIISSLSFMLNFLLTVFLTSLINSKTSLELAPLRLTMKLACFLEI